MRNRLRWRVSRRLRGRLRSCRSRHWWARRCVRSDRRMNRTASSGDGRPNGHRRSGRPFDHRGWRFLAGFGFSLGLDLKLNLGFRDRLSLQSRGCFRLRRRMGLGLSVRDRSRLGRGRSAVLRSFVGFAARWEFALIVAVIAAQSTDYVVFQRAGVRLLISDAEFGELLQYFVSFDFQLPRQLVNSDLSHR